MSENLISNEVPLSIDSKNEIVFKPELVENASINRRIDLNIANINELISSDNILPDSCDNVSWIKSNQDLIDALNQEIKKTMNDALTQTNRNFAQNAKELIHDFWKNNTDLCMSHLLWMEESVSRDIQKLNEEFTWNVMNLWLELEIWNAEKANSEKLLKNIDNLTEDELLAQIDKNRNIFNKLIERVSILQEDIGWYEDNWSYDIAQENILKAKELLSEILSLNDKLISYM